MGTWTYLVAYVAPFAGAGNAITTRPRPIDSADEVMDVEAWLRNNGVDQAVLTNVVLLKRRRFERWENRGTDIRRSSDPIAT